MPEPLSPTQSLEQIRAMLARFNELEFVTAWGVRVEALDEQRIRATIDRLRPAHRGGIQGSAVNGGVLAAMFDLTLGIPGLIRALPDRRSATVQLSMSFMHAVRGETLETTAWIERAGKSLLFAQGEIRDSSHALCATASGVVRLLDAYSEPRAF